MILVAGVGYQHMGDLSFGPLLIGRLRAGRQLAGVQVEDLSFGPIAVVQWFQDDLTRFERAIFIGAVLRGRPPGSLHIAEWSPPERGIDAVQERVNEAVTGVINLENTLTICDYFGVLPKQTMVIELEPVEIDWSEHMSPYARVRLDEALAWIESELGLDISSDDSSARPYAEMRVSGPRSGLYEEQRDE